MLGLYAYSNLHDLSWGTKGLEDGGGHGPAAAAGGNGGVKDLVALKKKQEAAKQRLKAEQEDVDNSFRTFRSGLLLVYLVTNALWLFGATTYLSSSCYLRYLGIVVGLFNFTRFMGSAIFILLRIIRRAKDPLMKNNKKGNYSQQLPPQWQSHYKQQNAETKKELHDEVHLDVNDTNAHYRNMKDPSTTSL